MPEAGWYQDKFLVWDGAYDTSAAAECNKRYLDAGHVNADQQTGRRRLRVALGAEDAASSVVIHPNVSVRILSTTAAFVPILGHTLIKVRLKRVKDIRWLLLRVLDRNADLVYREVLTGDQVRQLPVTAPAEQKRSENLVRASAIHAEGPFKIQVWVGTGALPVNLMETKEVDDPDGAVLSALKAGNSHAALGLPAAVAHVTLKNEIWRAENEGIQYIIARTLNGRVKVTPAARGTPEKRESVPTFKVETHREPVEEFTKTVNDQSGDEWGKNTSDGILERTALSANNRDHNAVGLNQVNASAPHVRVMQYRVPTGSIAGRGTTFALTDVIAGGAEVTSWIRERLAIRARTEAFRAYANTLRRAPVVDPSATTNLLTDAHAKVSHFFSAARAAKGLIAGDADNVFKIFTAPEFFFTHKQGPYSKNEFYSILDKLMEGSKSRDFKDWMFVAGTVWWADRWQLEARQGQGAVAARWIDVVHNTLPVIMNGRILHTYLKRQPSGIDGLKEYTNSSAVARDYANTISDGLGAPNHTETWDRWITAYRDSLMKTDESPFFRMAGLQFGVEVCLDHELGITREEYEKRFPGGNGIDMHFIIACGLPHADPRGRRCNLCGHTSAAGSAACQDPACAANFNNTILCPGCGRTQATGTQTCAHCARVFSTHRCAPKYNAPTATTCARCTRALGMLPTTRPGGRKRICQGCGRYINGALAQCTVCGAQETSRVCRTCYKVYPANAAACTTANCVNTGVSNFLTCPNGHVGLAPTDKCGTCNTNMRSQHGLEPAFDAIHCQNCGQIHASTAVVCAAAACALDFRGATRFCPRCRRPHAAAANACASIECGWTKAICYCEPHVNAAAATTCARCNEAIELQKPYDDLPGNYVNLVARDGGYFVRNDGNDVTAEARRVTRAGNIAAKNIQSANIPARAREFTRTGFDTVSQDLPAYWRRFWTGLFERWPVQTFFPRAPNPPLDADIATALGLPAWTPHAVLTMYLDVEVQHLPLPEQTAFKASAVYTGKLTGWLNSMASSVDAFPVITDL